MAEESAIHHRRTQTSGWEFQDAFTLQRAARIAVLLEARSIQENQYREAREMRFKVNSSLLQVAAVLGTLLVLGACATPNPTVDTGAASEEMTYDGLYPIRNSTADAAWARPDADISRYSKIMLQGVGIEYRPGGESGRLYHSRSSADYYEISDQQKDRFKATMREAFLKELQKSAHFKIVNEAGPDVLLIRGGLLDVVSYVPPEPVGRSDIYLGRVGEATLVLEIRDSVSEAIIARAVDRRAADNTGRPLQKSNRAMNTAEVRRVAATWARMLRERLDSYGSTAR
jgi:hypothetical protein